MRKGVMIAMISEENLWGEIFFCLLLVTGFNSIVLFMPLGTVCPNLVLKHVFTNPGRTLPLFA